MNKRDRLDKIKEVIVSFTVSSQDELLNMLQTSGINVTQATLSRDLKQLKVAKIPTANGYRYSLSSKVVEHGRGRDVQSPSERLPAEIISIDFTDSLGIIKTNPGFASALAWSIDNYNDDRVLGTIAGDDTIFLAIKEHIARQDIIDLLSELFPEAVFEKRND